MFASSARRARRDKPSLPTPPSVDAAVGSGPLESLRPGARWEPSTAFVRPRQDEARGAAAGAEAFRPDTRSLVQRVGDQVLFESQRDEDALYELIDPVLRARREAAHPDEPERTRARIRSFLAHIHAARLESVEVPSAQKASPEHGGRPAAVVLSTVCYNGSTVARFRTVWVRDAGVWYSMSPYRSWPVA